MNKDLSNESKVFNKNNFINWIIGGIIALIIGKIMEPFFAFIFSLFLNIGGNLITYIADTTYKEISYGYFDQSASSAFYLIYICIFCFLGYTFGNSIKEYQTFKNIKKQITMPKSRNAILSESLSDNLEKENRKLKFSYLFIIIFLTFFMTILILFYGRSNFIRNKTIVMTNNIEIVSPYISDIEYKQLKSKFHSIETKVDFDSLTIELESIANEYSLKLK